MFPLCSKYVSTVLKIPTLCLDYFFFGRALTCSRVWRLHIKWAHLPAGKCRINLQARSVQVTIISWYLSDHDILVKVKDKNLRTISSLASNMLLVGFYFSQKSCSTWQRHFWVYEKILVLQFPYMKKCSSESFLNILYIYGIVRNSMISIFSYMKIVWQAFFGQICSSAQTTSFLACFSF